jgi:hypothetical protein
MAFDMDLLGDDFTLNAPGLKRKGLFKKNRDEINGFNRRLNFANTKGTGLLQEKLPFEDVQKILDPQRSLSLSQLTEEYDMKRDKIFKTFDTIRSRRGVSRSGFNDYAEQESLRSLAMDRQRSLFQSEERFEQLATTLKSRNDEVLSRNKQKLFDVFGDKIYDSLKSIREKK